jgi:CRP-like cAMP-binding protein
MIIDKANLFEGMGSKVVGEIEAAMGKETYEPGAFIFRGGDPSEYLYILLEGRVRLSLGGEGHVALVVNNVGDAFGLSSLVDRETYTASAECLGPTTVAKLRRDVLAAIFDRECAVGLIFYKRLAKLFSHRLNLIYKLLPAAHGGQKAAPGG